MSDKSKNTKTLGKSTEKVYFPEKVAQAKATLAACPVPDYILHPSR